MLSDQSEYVSSKDNILTFKFTSLIEAKESTQGNRVKSGSLAKALHRYEQGTEHKCQK